MRRKQNFRRFLFGMSPDVPKVKVRRAVLLVTFKFWIGVNDISNILTLILLNLLTFIPLPILRQVSICCARLLFGVGYYVNVQFTLRREIDESHYDEQNLSWNVYLWHSFTSIQNSRSLAKTRSLNAGAWKLISKKKV